MSEFSRIRKSAVALKHKPLDKRSLKRSFWYALGRLMGVGLSAGAGSFLYQMVGSSGTWAVGLAIGLATLGFLLTWFAEYEREIE